MIRGYHSTATGATDNETTRDQTSKRHSHTHPTHLPSTCIRVRLRTPTRTGTAPLVVLGPVPAGVPLTAAVAAVAAPGLAAEFPGLAARSLGFSKLLKKFCKTSCCVGLGAPPRLGDAGGPPRLPRPPRALLPSISASARSTVGSEKDDAPKGPTRPPAGAADASVGVRKMPRGSRSARRTFSS
jgi:hypothetical protein